MRTTWRPTQLSVVVPQSSDGSWEMAEGDVQPFGFDAQEAITGATAALIRLDTLVPSGTVGAPSINGTVATVVVSDLVRGYVYQLSVTLTAAAAGNRTWTRTLTIPCVA